MHLFVLRLEQHSCSLGCLLCYPSMQVIFSTSVAHHLRLLSTLLWDQIHGLVPSVFHSATLYIPQVYELEPLGNDARASEIFWGDCSFWGIVQVFFLAE